MRSKRALFISRTSALKTGLSFAMKEGHSHEVCFLKVRHYPVFHRGELQGFECWIPHGTETRPIMEDMVA